MLTLHHQERPDPSFGHEGDGVVHSRVWCDRPGIVSFRCQEASNSQWHDSTPSRREPRSFASACAKYIPQTTMNKDTSMPRWFGVMYTSKLSIAARRVPRELSDDF